MVTDAALPKKPDRPLDSDCCGQGCVPCVLYLYEDEVKIWEDECCQLLAGQTVDQQHIDGPALSETEYRQFTIYSVTSETHDTSRYRFHLPHGVELGLQIGQHIIVRGEVDGHVITRQYTPVTDVHTKGHFDLLIKEYSDGHMSAYVKTWAVGTDVYMRGPSGSLTYQPNKYRVVYLLCVGTGIAPMAQVIQTILNNETDETRIHLLYGCHTYGDILLKKDLDEWAYFWNFKCEFFLSQETKCISKYRYGEVIHSKRIDKTVVETVIKNISDSFLVLICGTRTFEANMIANLKDIGIPADNYHKF